MVRNSVHVQMQRRIIQEARVKSIKIKHAFSPSFSEKLYDFSEKFHMVHFKAFNHAFEEWLFENRAEVEGEAAAFNGSREEILKKIKISARFYYRKKSKKAAKTAVPQVKPYIGLSVEFICMMDEFITEKIVRGKVIKKEMFAEFSFSHICQIDGELKTLKEKYDISGNDFKPTDIAKKFKKAFDNRFHMYYHTNTIV
jgi:hypothetical protein